MAAQSHIHRPTPRRTFELTPATPVSTDPSLPPSPTPETNQDLSDNHLTAAATPSKTRSVLNLTSSTLLGIYSGTGYEVSREETTTPWGTGAQTPSHRQSIDGSISPPQSTLTWETAKPKAPADCRRAAGFRGYYLPLILRGVLLFLFGIAYGTIITHLHDQEQIAPVKVEGIRQDSWQYLVFWGISGVGLGNLLPIVDVMWEDSSNSPQSKQQNVRRRRGSSSGSENYGIGERPDSQFGYGPGADWTLAVRSVGAFVGIAFAIRKLPWQSTLQVSLTLALANPVLWYLIDRSKPGFLLSAIVGIAGTFALLGINPDMVPSPAMPSSVMTAGNASTSVEGLSRFITNETIGVWTWVASVLFCSCVCFGNVGRRLALER